MTDVSGIIQRSESFENRNKVWEFPEIDCKDIKVENDSDSKDDYDSPYQIVMQEDVVYEEEVTTEDYDKDEAIVLDDGVTCKNYIVKRGNLSSVVKDKKDQYENELYSTEESSSQDYPSSSERFISESSSQESEEFQRNILEPEVICNEELDQSVSNTDRPPYHPDYETKASFYEPDIIKVSNVIVKCKRPCIIPETSSNIHHKKKNNNNNLINTQTQDFVKSKRKRKSATTDDFVYDSDSLSSDTLDWKLKSASTRREIPKKKKNLDRYQELRRRNNESSRRSRLNRKLREIDLKSQVVDLEDHNKNLKGNLKQLENEVCILRKLLMQVAKEQKRTHWKKRIKEEVSDM